MREREKWSGVSYGMRIETFLLRAEVKTGLHELRGREVAFSFSFKVGKSAAIVSFVGHKGKYNASRRRVFRFFEVFMILGRLVITPYENI